MGIGLFCHVSGVKVWGNGLQLCQQRFRLLDRKGFFSVRVVRHWNKLPREDVESLSSLEMLKNHLDVTLGIGLGGDCGGAG